MSLVIKFKKYPSSTIATTIGQSGELIIDSTKNVVTVHDGITLGGTALASESYVNTVLSGSSTGVYMGGVLTIANTTNSTSTTTGALVVTGGLGVSGNTTFSNITYTGKLTGSTNILNIGSGQIYKDASGNVGIGTSSPSYKLDVVGAVRSTSAAAFYTQGSANIGVNNGLILGTLAKNVSPIAGTGAIQILSNDATNQLQASMSLITDVTSNTNYRLAFNCIEQGIAFRNITLCELGGNVGIGTSSPVTKLDVSTSSVWGTSTIPAIQISNNGSAGIVTNPQGLGALSWNSNTGTTAQIEAVRNNPQSGLYTSLVFRNWTIGAGLLTETMRIDSSGNVGIGTSSPSKSLHVYTNTGNGIYVEDSSAANASPTVRIRGWRSDANGSQTFGGGLVLERKGGVATASGNVLGTIYFGGNYDTTPNFGYAASISGVADGAFTSSTNTPTALTFYTGITPNLDTNNANVTTGTERMRIDSSGNVGIGTSAGTAKLHVVSTSSTAYGLISQTPTVGLVAGDRVNMAYITNSRGAYNDGLRFINYRDSTGSGVGNWETESYAIERNIDNVAAQSSVRFGSSYLRLDTAGVERLRIDASGNVGIGTSSPAGGGGGTLLNVYGASAASFRVSSSTSTGDIFVSGSELYIQQSNATGSIIFRTNAAAERMRIDSSGNVGIGTSSPLVVTNQTSVNVNGTSASRYELLVGGTRTSYVYTDATAMQVGSITTIPVQFMTAGTERMRIDSSGAVGIGTSSPSTYGKLAVAGSIGLIGNFNQFLHNDTSVAATSGGLVRFASNGAGSYAYQINTAVAGDFSTVKNSYLIDQYGNIGIGGTTPSGATGGGMLQLGNTAQVSFKGDTGYINANIYYNAGWKYASTAAASLYQQVAGAHIWSYAASGTIDTAVTPTEAMRIDSTGKVGIGISPVKRLDILDTALVSLKIQSSFLSGNKTYSGLQIGASTNGQACTIGYSYDSVTPANSFAHITPYGSTEGLIFAIAPSGNVGIGTRSPSTKLHVVGNIAVNTTLATWNTNASVIQVANASLWNNNLTTVIGSNVVYGAAYAATRIGSTYSALMGFNMDGVGSIDFTTFGTGLAGASLTGSPAMRIDSSGNVGIGTTAPFNSTTTFATAKSPVLGGDGAYYGGGAYYDAGWKNVVASQGGWVLRNTGGTFAFWTGTNSGASGSISPDFSEKMRIDSAGNMGIGVTPSGTYKLEVNGGISATSFTGVMSSSNLAYTGTFTGGTGVLNIGSGQVYKDASGNVGIGTASIDVNYRLVVIQTANFNNAAKFRINDNHTTAGYGYGIHLQNNDTTVNNYTTIGNIDSAGGMNSWIEFTNVAHSTVTPQGAIGFNTRNGTNYLRKMTIDMDGNVGIGTSSPTALLTVKKGTISFDPPNPSYYAASIYNAANAVTRYGLQVRTNWQSSENKILSCGVVDAVTGTDYEMFVLNGVGNVGIGTISPVAKLDVQQSTIDLVGLSILNANNSASVTTSSSLRLGIYNSSGTSYARIMATETSVDSWPDLIFGVQNAATTTPSERMRITSTGGVNIGTYSTDPGANNLKVIGTATIGSTVTINGYAVCGTGTGSVAMTYNDGYGNANITFNHYAGIPDNTSVGAGLGSSARITSSVDSATGYLGFQIGDATSSGVAVGLTAVMNMYTTGIYSTVPFYTTTLSTSGQTTHTVAATTAVGGGSIYLNGATSNRIDFNTNGVNPPSFTTVSTGTKIVLYPNVGAATVDFAIGIANNTLWNSVPNSVQQFQWYAGTTAIATLSGAGALTLGTALAIGSGGTGATTAAAASTNIGITQQNGTRSNLDFNTKITTGFYNYDAAPTNGPGHVYAQLIVAQGLDTGLQISGGYTNALAYRGWGGSGSTFTAWKTILDSTNYAGYATFSGAVSGTTITSTVAIGTAPFTVTSTTPVTNLSIGGNAATATGLNSGNYISRTGSTGNANTDFQNTPAGSVRHNGDDANLTNGPGGAWWFYNNYRHSNGSNYWGTQIAWGWEDNYCRLMQRNVSGGTWNVGWTEYLNTGGRTFTGSLTMSGSITSYSDETLKTDWSPVIPDFINRLSQVKSGSYTRIDSSERQAGVSAQDIQKILPETVLTDEHGKLSIAYGNAALLSSVELAKEVVILKDQVTLLIETIKEQQKQIDLLKQ